MSKVTLNGYVVASEDQWVYDYFGVPAFSPATVRAAIEANPQGEALEVEINSGGGSVFAGFEIYSLLYAAKCETVAIVQSLAGSAASTVMSACKRVLMSPVAQVMIHLPMSCVEGNQEDMEHEAKVLESITQSILNGYLVRCGGKCDRAKLEQLMRDESWITAQEAVELGLADSILGDEESGGKISATIINSVSSGLRALVNNNQGLLPTQELLSRYEQAVRSGSPPVEGHPALTVEGFTSASEGTRNSWQQRASVDLERARYRNIKEV